MTIDDRTLDRLSQLIRSTDLEHSRYQFGGLIASGGMGSVYEAHDRLLDRDVAIKVLRGDDPDPGLASRLDQEARILGGLDHPGLVPVHDAGVLGDGRPFYVMRLVRGVRLDQYLQGPVGLAERLRLFLRICEPVGFAHAHGVIHRDLKPANIMVGPYGEVLVLDWGIAKVKGKDDSGRPGMVRGRELGVTGAGMVLGTEGYMAPEQASGGEVDERADGYSLGAILRDLLAGAPNAPRPLAAIRNRAMAARPEERYRSVSDLAAEVTRFLDGEPVLAYRESWPERTLRLAARHRTALGLVLAYLLMRVLLLALGSRR